MSGATAKAVRRDLRRAVGEEAAGIIDAHTQVIDNQIIPNINTLTAQRDNHENRIRILEEHDRAWYDLSRDIRLSAGQIARDRRDDSAIVEEVSAARYRSNSAAQKKIFDRLHDLDSGGFWRRLRWLMTGR